ncbi:MAG: T9SS type A sorting domain-containing protein, partial [Ginsengibacter sp.]
MSIKILFKLLYVFTLISSFPSFILGQNISVDVTDVIRTIPPNAIGINMNYLMDGTYISSNTQSATATALKNMGMKFLRYPGGEKSDNYLWSQSPYTHAAPAMTLTGSCQWPSGDSRFVNSDYATAKSVVLDFDEFVTIYKQVGAEPIIVCAYDAAYYSASVGHTIPNPCGQKPLLSTLVTNAKEWVKYANITKGYKIKYWCIGNESWNLCDYNGCVSATQYAADIVTFASAMKSVDPTIKIIANGRGSVWWQTLLQSNAASYIDYLGVSCYPIYNYSGGYETYRTMSSNLLNEAQTAVNSINTYATPSDKLRIKIITTEYNAIDFGNGWTNTNDVGHSLVVFDIMGQHLKNPQIESALFWNTRWVTNTTSPQNIDDALDKNSNLNASGLALSIWGNNMLPELLNASSTGSGNNFIKVFADYDDATNKLNLFMLNKDDIDRTINFDISNYIASPFYQRLQYKGTNVSDKFPTYTVLDAAPVQLAGYPASFTLPKNSITVFKFDAAGILDERTISLKAELNPGRVSLNWNRDAAYCEGSYYVQSSDDGVKWNNAGELQADCNINNGSYSFEDNIENSGSEIKYYRVKHIDEKGFAIFSNIARVKILKDNDLQIRMVANPVSDWTKITIRNPGAVTGDIVIRDSYGSVIRTIRSVRIESNIKFSTKHFPSGLYYVEVTAGASHAVVKFIKL